jgi:16S rRNA (guanine(527)-N(7))-methyltransferase RsmG
MSRNHTDQFRLALEAAVSSFRIDELNEEQTGMLVGHYSMLRRWNQRLNLTRISEPKDAAKLHYAESLFGARFIGGAQTLLDIGSGAGFPAIPLAVARPDVQVTALEANQKKSVFLKEVKDELGLGNLKVASARLEEFDWADYELLTSRALDRAEAVLPSVIASLNPTQRLLLFSTRELVEKLDKRADGEPRVEFCAIPHSKERLLAIFTQK